MLFAIAFGITSGLLDDLRRASSVAVGSIDGARLLSGARLETMDMRGRTMDTNAEVFVTLSADLLARLRKAARQEHIPLQWLIAGLVCDTVDVARLQDRAHEAAVFGR